MGTSKSYDGPKDRTPLLPSWAFPDDAGNGSQPLPSSPDPPLSAQSSNTWRAAKLSFGKAVSGSGGRGAFAKAGRKYVGALGGARRATRASRAGRASTARLGQFLSSVGSRGLNETLERLGLSSFVGKNAETVFTAISNALAPAGASREEAIARDAVHEALENLYERSILADGDLTKLDQMGTQEITQALETAVSSYIFRRWLGELEIVIEKKAMSAKEAVRLERDMRAYINECVQLDMQRVDMFNMDWNSTSGQQFIEKIFTEAYRILEEGQ